MNATEYNRKWRARNSEHVRKYNREWRARNSEHVRKYKREWYVQNSEYMREWRARNSEHVRKYKREWRAQNSEHVRKYNREWYVQNSEYMREWHLKRKYGLTVEEYDALLANQDGVCGICHRPRGSRRLAVDHDHTSGAVRGLLCSVCNRALGWFENNQEAALAWLGDRGGEGWEHATPIPKAI